MKRTSFALSTSVRVAGHWLLPAAALVAFLGLAACASSEPGADGDGSADSDGTSDGTGDGDGDTTGDGTTDTGGSFPDAGPVGETVTITGRVMAPSGAFPISGALVHVTRTTPDPIPTGAYEYECDEITNEPYALSAADGTFSIDVPEGSWKIVTRKGNFRRIRDLDVVAGMDPAIPEATTTLPGAATQDGLDTIPTYAVVRTEPDLTYNLLAKFGLGQTNGSGALIDGTEQFDLYEDSGVSSYPHTSALFDDQTVIDGYQMVFLPCFSSNVGVTFVNNNIDKLRNFVSKGGRIYNSCTVSLWSEAAFPDYVDFYQSDATTKFDIGRRTNGAYATTGNVLDADMAAWLSVVTSEQPTSMPFQNGFVTIDATVEVDDGHGREEDNGVVKPYTWVEDNGTYPGSPLMVTYNYDAGKVFYSVYETSAPSTALTPQEYVLLYVILEVGVCENLPPPVE